MSEGGSEGGREGGREGASLICCAAYLSCVTLNGNEYWLYRS